MIQNMGKMLCRLREETGISQMQLGRGLAGVVELSRLENGSMETDVFLLEALLQRMGKSADKLELAISEKEYQIMMLRTMIQEGFCVGDYGIVKILLEEYEAHSDSDKPLHRQFLLWMKALHSYLSQESRDLCAGQLAEAIEVTFCRWREKIPTDCCLCMQEIRILLFLCYLQLEMGDTYRAREKLEELVGYLEVRYTDMEEKGKIFPQCAWILGKACCAQGDWGRAYNICGQGVVCLTENGVLTVMDKLLEVQSICLEKMGRGEEASEMAKVRGAIAFLYQITGSRRPEEDMPYLLLVCEQKELLVNRKLLKEMRLSKRLSQGELSEGICSWETLSRMEGGGRTPSRKKLYQMFRRMGLDREKYYGYIQADDFELYEKVHKIHAKWVRGDREGATALIEELSKKLDMSIPVNRQFIETHRLLAAAGNGSISMETAIHEAERILRYTMKDYQGIVYRTPFRQECVLLNQIALYLRYSGRMEEAIQLWQQMLDRLQADNMPEQYHAASLMLIYTNYAGSLEVNGHLEKAEKMNLKGIRLALKCQRADNAAKFLANIACVYEKRGTQAEDALCEECLRNSFYLLHFYQHNRNSKAVKAYYEKKYGRSPD